MKKIMLFCALFVLMSSNVFAGSFPDVSKDHENFEAIEYLNDLGVVKGYGDGTFMPQNVVNRAEAMKMILESLKIKHNGTYEAVFPDVKKDSWFFEYVMAAKEDGIINGYKDGKFKPENGVNLAESLKMLFGAAKVELPEITDSELAVYTDVDGKSWYSPYFLYARTNNILTPDEYGNVSPIQAMTRAKFAEVVYRMAVVLEQGGKPYPMSKNWETYESDVLPFKMKYDLKNWQIIKSENEVVFFKPDKEFLQFSPSRIFPNSAVIRVNLDKNEQKLSKEQYFNNIKGAFKNAGVKTIKVSGLNAMEIYIAEPNIKDWYVYLADGSVLAVYTEHGNGTLDAHMDQYIREMLSTLEYQEVVVNEVDNSALISAVLANVLVEGTGKATMEKIDDEEIIETDTIGVGTGPVDYYYSKSLDYTLKYERGSDTILDTRNSKTTAF